MYLQEQETRALLRRAGVSGDRVGTRGRSQPCLEHYSTWRSEALHGSARTSLQLNLRPGDLVRTAVCLHSQPDLVLLPLGALVIGVPADGPLLPAAHEGGARPLRAVLLAGAAVGLLGGVEAGVAAAVQEDLEARRAAAAELERELVAPLRLDPGHLLWRPAVQGDVSRLEGGGRCRDGGHLPLRLFPLL